MQRIGLKSGLSLMLAIMRRPMIIEIHVTGERGAVGHKKEG
jgi:hypothetical protein